MQIIFSLRQLVVSSAALSASSPLLVSDTHNCGYNYSLTVGTTPPCSFAVLLLRLKSSQADQTSCGLGVRQAGGGKREPSGSVGAW